MYIEKNCMKLLDEISEEQFKFILAWIVAREKHRDTAGGEQHIENLDRVAAEAWNNIENGMPFDEAMEPLAPASLHVLLQPLPKQCLDQVDAVLDRVRTPDAKDAESIANYAPLVGMGWDPKTCTMDWIEAAHVGLVLRGGSKEAAQCNLTFAIKQWLEYKKAVAADSTNSKPLSGGGGRMGPPYQQKIIDDPVYKDKWPMPNAPAVFQKIGVGQKLGVLQNASAASGEDGGAAKIVAWTVGIGALALLGAWIGGVWPFASKKNETVKS